VSTLPSRPDDEPRQSRTNPQTEHRAPIRTDALRELGNLLRYVQRDNRTARAHLTSLQEQFERHEADLDRARSLLAAYSATTSASSDAGNEGRSIITVNLLGAFRAAIGPTDITAWNSGRAKALFTYLVSHRKARVSRDQLIEALWPGGDQESAANSLRVAVHALRLALATAAGDSIALSRDAFVQFENGAYSLNPDLRFNVDVEEFEDHWLRGRALEIAGARDRAIREYELAEVAYHGDFLQDDPYEEWSTLRREGLKDIILAILGRLSESAFEALDYEGCIMRCQKIIETDPCREDAYQRLIRSHVLLGQPSRAHRWYEICVRVLKEELDIDPSPETEAAYRELFRKGRPKN
jgi:LuxR family transcriptional regulator, maltose regulon positive regulatory protein